jgi:hypothetical protein
MSPIASSFAIVVASNTYLIIPVTAYHPYLVQLTVFTMQMVIYFNNQIRLFTNIRKRKSYRGLLNFPDMDTFVKRHYLEASVPCVTEYDEHISHLTEVFPHRSLFSRTTVVTACFVLYFKS